VAGDRIETGDTARVELRHPGDALSVELDAVGHGPVRGSNTPILFAASSEK
jgi:hypothetical protein